MRRTSIFALLIVPAVTLASPQNLPALPMPPNLPPPQEMATRMIEQRFAQADTNHDGKLTLEEAKSGMSLIVPVFDQIDTSRKGYVTLDQIKEFAKNQATR
jgi:hypothetical protein